MSSTKTVKRGKKKKTDRAPTKPGKAVVRTGRQKYPWDDMSQAFIDGMPTEEEGVLVYPSLKQIAEQFDAPYQTVRERAAAERWTEQQNGARIKKAQELAKARQATQVREAIAFDDLGLGISRGGLRLIQVRIAEITMDVKDFQERRAEAKRKQDRGEPVEPWELWSAVNYREMESLARAALSLQEMGRKALGIDIDRMEISGPEGGPVEVSVRDEMLRDDPERLVQMLLAVQRSGLLDENASDVVEGELVEEDEDAE